MTAMVGTRVLYECERVWCTRREVRLAIRCRPSGSRRLVVVRSKSTDPDKRLALINGWRYTACAEPVDVCPTKPMRYLVVVESCGKHRLCLTLFDCGEAECRGPKRRQRRSQSKRKRERRKELDKRLSVLAARIVWNNPAQSGWRGTHWASHHPELSRGRVATAAWKFEGGGQYKGQ